MKGKLKTFNPINDRKNPSFGRTVKVNSRKKDGTSGSVRTVTIKEFGKRFNLWTIKDGKRQKEHPAIFPEQLANDHVISWSNENDLVYDCFGGSGTTPKMAKVNNRRWIVSETSIAAGVRRIEAITGEMADKIQRREKNDLLKIRSLLNVSDGDFVIKIEQLVDERKQLIKELGDLRVQIGAQKIDPLIKNAETIDNFKFISVLLEVESVDEMKKSGDLVRIKLKSGIGVIGSVIDNKPFLLCVVTDDLIKSKNLKAGDIIKKLAKHIQGGGGGRAHMAQAGGKDSSKLTYALEKAKETIESMI